MNLWIIKCCILTIFNSLLINELYVSVTKFKYKKLFQSNSIASKSLNSFKNKQENFKEKWFKKTRYMRYYTKLSKQQYNLLILVGIVSISIFMFGIVQHFIIAMSICIDTVLLGLICIQYFDKKASNELSEGIVPLVMGINAEYSQTGDIFEAMLKSTSKMKPSLIKDQIFLLIGKINNGYGVESAYQSLIENTSHRTFRYVLLNLKEISINQCDGEHLLMALESELMDYNHQYNQKKVEIERQQKWIVTFLVLIVIITMHSILQSGYMKYFYFTTAFGNMLIATYILIVGVSLYLFSTKQARFTS